ADTITQAKIDEVFNSPLQFDKRHEDLLEIKRILNANGYGGITVTDYFGSFTERRVKEFQRDHGLPVSGIIDEITLEKILALKPTPTADEFEFGDRHPLIIELKHKLNRIGFGYITVTDYYGDFTTRRVREFQQHYGLEVTGKVDTITQAKIDEVFNSPLQVGKRHDDLLLVKEKLNANGYGGITITDYFGSFTERRVKEFQRDNGLPESGIIDEKTLELINALQVSREIITYTQYNLTLQEAIQRQLNLSIPPQTDKYKNQPAYVHGGFVEIKGKITGSSVRIRSAPHFDDTLLYYLPNGTDIIIQGKTKGALYNGSDQWYRITHNGDTSFVHTTLAEIQSAKTTSGLNVRAETNTNSHIYTTLSKDTSISIREIGDIWHEISLGSWRNATREDFSPFIDPNKNDIFQHLVLDHRSGVSLSQLNNVLFGRGTLEGMGEHFLEAGRQHSVNEIYLIAHALLETGAGTPLESQLSRGVLVGKNSNGNPVLVTSTNRDSLSEIRTVYNMYGIGANDSDAHRLGAIRAYNEEWFSKKEAIIGGAAFISNDYFARGQNTIYKMRWNHKYLNAQGWYPQYATDMGWAVKQVPRIKSLYNQLNNPTLHFDIVQYN
ncbi:peptidoglycan-binding protein, partial [Evansella tamaricis]